MISGCGRSAGAVIPALGSGRYTPGPNIVLPSWLKGSDPNFTINGFWGQPGALATVSKKRTFLSRTIGEEYERLFSPYFGEITLTMPLLHQPVITLAFFA